VSEKLPGRSALTVPRGGANKSTKKRKKGKKSSSKEDSKQSIAKALEEKDAAEALGDAVRSTAAEWRNASAISSIGWAMGAVPLEDPGVEAAPTAVVVHYFLKSHGGAHALQSACSALATAAGLLACVAPLKMRCAVIQRCLMLAMVKYVSGLLAACLVTAKTIPVTGYREALSRMESLVDDPVAQYLFYTACTMLWMPTEPWHTRQWAVAALVGPVVLREAVSTAWVIADVLVLLTCSREDIEKGGSALVGMANAFLSILFTPARWRGATLPERQGMLAKRVSQLSLALEVAVGLIMTVDAFTGLVYWTMGLQLGGITARPNALGLFKRCICTRLYFQFLWNRRQKIQVLATDVRGGAAQFPMYVMQVLMDPAASMGLAVENKASVDNSTSTSGLLSWKDYVKVALGLDED